MYDTTDLPTRYEFTADLTRPRQGNMLFFTRVLQLRMAPPSVCPSVHGRLYNSIAPVPCREN